MEYEHPNQETASFPRQNMVDDNLEFLIAEKEGYTDDLGIYFDCKNYTLCALRFPWLSKLQNYLDSCKKRKQMKQHKREFCDINSNCSL